MKKNWKLIFFTIWVGQAFSLAGSSIARFALIWWVTKSTGSATVLATATLVSILPTVLLGPFAAAMVDRWDKRVVMIVADSFIALVSAWLAWLFWRDQMQVWHVYVIMLLRSIGGTFHGPAMVVATSLIVPEKQLGRVAGLNQTLHGIMNIATPPLGALLLSVLPLHAIMAIDVVTAVIAVTMLFFVCIPQPRKEHAEDGVPGLRTVLEDVRIALRYVWRWRGLMLLFCISGLITVMIRPAFALIPILVTSHFNGQALELAWIESALGIGIMMGGIVLGVWGGFKRRVITILAGIVGIGLGLFLISVIPASLFWLALVLIFVAGFMFPIIDGPLVALIQGTVEADMRGRVFSLMVSMSEALSPLSMIIAGPVSDRFGVRTWYAVGGLACAALGLVGFAIPAVVRLEDEQADAVVVAVETG